MPIKRHRCLYLNRKRESELLNTDKIKNYTIIEKKELPEVSGTGYLLRHDKTKARVMLIDNADENKVFCIGFRTPPSNSKGVQHIIEQYHLTPDSTRFTQYTLDIWFSIVGLLNPNNVPIDTLFTE